MHRLSLHTKVLLFFATLFTLMVLQAVYFVVHEYRLLKSEVTSRAAILSQALSEMSREPLLSLHITRLEEQLDSMRKEGGLDYAQIVDRGYRVIADTRRSYEGWILSGPIAHKLEIDTYRGSVVARAPIYLGDDLIGMTEIRVSLTAMLGQVRTNSLIAAGMFFVEIVFAMLFAWFLERQIVTPLRIVAQTADRIPSDEEIRKIPKPRLAAKEILGVVSAINAMQVRLNQHTRLETIGKMAASVAHEIRNPLEAMSGAVEILSTSASRDSGFYLEIIREEITNLNAYLTEFLAFSSARTLANAPVQMEPIVEHALNLLKPMLMRSNIEVSATLEPCSVLGNAEELRRLLVNLLLNAIDAQANGEGWIRVELTRDEGGVELVVADHGHGIPTELLDVVFDAHTTTKERGFGLGLPFCKTVAERHHGSISIKSEPEKGTTVAVRLPAHA